jgi:outer membrane protein assembly factor BamE
MGTPSIESPFDQDRWDYASSFSNRGREPEVKNLTLVFENSALVRIEGDYFPQRNEEMLEQSRQIKGKVDEELDTATKKPAADDEPLPPASEPAPEEDRSEG